MLRTLFVLALVAYGIRHSVRGPFYALLFYLWLAYFRPEQWVWGGIVQQLPLSLLVGTTVLIASAMSMQLVFNARVALLLAVAVHSAISTAASPYSEFAWPYWMDFAKSTAITWIIVSLVTDVARLRLVMLVIALSLGFEAAKQGWLQLVLNPGAQNINELTAIGDNNGVAVAMYVLVAFLIALGRTASTKKEAWLHRFLAAGSLYRGIATYSRGGFIAGGAVGLFYIARSKRRFRAVLALVVLAAMIAPVLPEEFWARMGTIRTAFSSPDPESEELDVSSRGRLYFWQVAREMAADRPFLGIGHNAYTQAYDAYDRSNGEYGQNRSVHSTWMGTLAELGYPGLALLIVNMGLAWLACRRARRLKGDSREHVQLREFANALEVSLVAIAVGGTFVIFQYTELLWHVLGLSIALQRLASRAAEAPAVTPKPVVRLPMVAARPVVVSRSV